MSMYKTILVEKKDGYAIIKINRPDVFNAINPEVTQELECAVFELEGEKEIAAVILTGAGEKAFVAGADIKYMSSIDSLEALQMARNGQKVLSAIENSEKIYIAAVNGFALGGGCEISMACDIRVASENAKFSQPEINIGVMPGWAGTQRLTWLVGATKAKELILTGDMIDASEAYRIGLVNKVVPLTSLMQEAEAFAAKMKAKPPVALKLAKHAINFGRDASFSAAQHFEAQAFAMLFSTSDQKEGMKAFLEKRKASFLGK
jgi:enoyl-CoA hydratase